MAKTVDSQFVSIKDLATKFGISEKRTRKIVRSLEVPLRDNKGTAPLRAGMTNARKIYSFKAGGKLLAWVESAIESNLNGAGNVNEDDFDV